MIPEHEICESNRIVDLNNKPLIDLVVACTSSQYDTDILNKWKDDFLKRQIPFILQEQDRMMMVKGVRKPKKFFTLWSEEVAPPTGNAGQTYKKEKVIFKL